MDDKQRQRWELLFERAWSQGQMSVAVEAARKLGSVERLVMVYERALSNGSVGDALSALWGIEAASKDQP